MAKTKITVKPTKASKSSDDNFLSNIAKETGGTILKGSGESAYYIDTGNLALNYLCTGRFFGGGIPTGITECYGPSSSAKSLLGYTLGGQVQKMGGYFVLLDFERAANERFAESAGHLDSSKVVVLTPNSILDCQQKIMAVTQLIRTEKGPDAPILFVWDSIGVAMSDREFRELLLPPNYTKEQYKKIVGGKEQPGERAKETGAFLRKVNPFLNKNNASLFIINQIRDKIGVMFGSPETTAGGGKGLPFYANTRLRTSAQKKITDKKLEIPIGVNLKFANKKSRSFVPFLETEGVQLYFNRGINPLGGMLTTLRGAGRVELAGKGMWKVNEPWAGGKEITFKASLERNDIAADVLYKCPAVVDAKDEEQIREYLGVFAEAIDLSNSDNVVEVPTDDDEASFGEEEDASPTERGETDESSED